MLQAALSRNKKNFSDQVGEVLGYYKFIYYQYLNAFHCEPRDLEDLIDGIIYSTLMKEQEVKSIQRSAKK